MSADGRIKRSTVAGITSIYDEFEAYGYRRVGAALRHQGIDRQFQEGAPPDA